MRIASIITGSLIAAAALSALAVVPARGQDGQALTRASKNPFANVINVPFIYDANLNTGPDHKTQQVLNIEPLIPFSVSADWILVTRTIVPLITQPGLAPGQSRTSGLGDTQLSTFLSPARAEHLVWGAGAVFQLPSATDNALGQGKWGAGPTAGAVWYGEQWTFGALFNNTWSFAGDTSRPAVNQMQLQPMINYNFPDNPDRYLSFSPTIAANWKASGDERWTVPVSLGIGQLVKFGKQPVNLQATGYYNVVRPNGASNWTLEMTVQFLFPK
jgi:hypothetical protein